MASTTARISEAESAVMQELWRRGDGTAEELLEALSPQHGWQEATVKTLLNRLLKKGAVAARKEGRRYRYRPLLSEDRWILAESRGLVDRLFGGRVAPLVAHFSEHGKLGRRDIEELRALIEEIDDGR